MNWSLLMARGNTGGLFARRSDVGGTAVVGDDDRALDAVVVVKGDIELIGESVNNGGANAETSKRAGARIKRNLSEVGPVGAVFLEFVVKKGENLFGNFVARFPRIGVVIEFKLTDVGGSVEIHFHKVDSGVSF